MGGDTPGFLVLSKYTWHMNHSEAACIRLNHVVASGRLIEYTVDVTCVTQ
jgi:hypothetical protein